MGAQKKAAGLRRAIPEDFTYNPKKLKHLKHVLHNVSVALGTLSSALNEFSKLKGPEISPDGLLGGVGYIIPIQEIKQGINTSVHTLSNVADCIADELTNPRWNAREDKEVKELIKEKDKVTDKLDEQQEELMIAPDGDLGPEDIVTVDNPDGSGSDDPDDQNDNSDMEPREKVLQAAVQRKLVANLKQNKRS